MQEIADKAEEYSSQRYWNARQDLMYYHYIDYLVRVFAKDSKSILDVGTGNCPYLEWFPWIEKRVSVDVVGPYRSSNVTGIEGDIFSLDVPEKFDLCTCFQVLEHVDDARAFAQRLFELGRNVMVSVPYKWKAGITPGHVHDPVDEEKVEAWFGRKFDYKIIVEEPLRRGNGKRLIGVFLEDNTGWREKHDFRTRKEKDFSILCQDFD